jgi:hypothetical protein
MSLPADSKLKLSMPEKDSIGYYSWEKKIDVATKYMALGNMRSVGELTGIPYVTLIGWKRTEWWGELIEEIRKTRKTEMNTKLSKIVDKSLAVIEDRLENGDWVMTKDGDLSRRPVTMKDANTVTKDLLAHQVRVEEMTNKLEVQKETVQDQLQLLAKEFAKWSKKLSNNVAEDITPTGETA